MKQSNYNIIVKLPNSSNSLVYNTLYGGLICLEPEYLNILKECKYDSNIIKYQKAFEELKNQKFIIEDDEDEFEFLKYEYYKAMFDNAELALTIAPTLACNFKCPYCYETSRNNIISSEGINAILDFVKEKYETNSFKKIKVNWYGGEPLIAIDSVVQISNLLIDFSNTNNIEYSAKMITNGSLINDEILKKLKSIKVSNIQITIDGTKEKNDKRRLSKDGTPTYQKLVNNVKKTADCGIGVEVRMNTDNINKEDYLKLVDIFKEYDNVDVYMGHLIKYKNNDELQCFDFLSKEEYGKLSYKMSANVKCDYENIFECKKMYCGATQENNFIIDEECNVYKCWNDIGNNDKVIYNLLEKPDNRKVNKKAFLRYMSWNPFNKEQCKNCKIFPICAGGCAYESIKDNELYCYPPKYAIDQYIISYYEGLKK